MKLRDAQAASERAHAYMHVVQLDTAKARSALARLEAEEAGAVEMADRCAAELLAAEREERLGPKPVPHDDRAVRHTGGVPR